ncbi:MAG: phage holin family protein [Bacteroides sp.]|nr:phage holin family protein [Bacteroides sp.]
MFNGSKNIENFQELFAEVKKYLELQKEYTKLELVEKLSILFSMPIMILVVVVLALLALFYLSLALAYILEPYVGGLKFSFLIIGGINLLFMICMVAFKKRLFIDPMVRFLSNLF